jgi:uncharacterized protein
VSLRVTNLRLPVEQSELELSDIVARRLKLQPDDLTRLRILRKSLDARSRGDMKFVYTLEIEPRPGVMVTRKPDDCEVGPFDPETFDDPPAGDRPLEHRPIVVGAGPGGLLAGYYLALRGYSPLIIERGKPVKERVPAIRLFDSGGPHDPENNYLFGEGGAGEFSDGKLTCRMTGPDVDWVLRSFVDCRLRRTRVARL